MCALRKYLGEYHASPVRLQVARPHLISRRDSCCQAAGDFADSIYVMSASHTLLGPGAVN